MADDTTVAPAPVPVTPPASAPTGPGRRRKATGTVGQIVGVIGLVVSIALIVGVVLFRGWAAGAVSDVATALDTGIAKTEPMLDKASAAVEELTARVGDAADAAEAIAIDPEATPEGLQGVLETLSAVSERYLALHDAYAQAREQIMTALGRLETIDRLLPGFSVPEGPVDALAAVDEKIRTLDTAIMGLIDAGTGLNAVNTAAQAVADKAHEVEAGLASVSEAIDQVAGRVDKLRTDVSDLAATVTTAINVLCVVLVLLLAYLALLHVVLFRSSRGYARGSAAT